MSMADSLRDLRADYERYTSNGVWREETLPARVREHARTRGDATAVIDSDTGETFSWSRLWEDACRVATYLRDEWGLERRDVVSVQLPNTYVTVVLQLAVLTGGHVLNILLPNYGPRDVHGVLSRSHSRALFTLDVFRSSSNAETLRLVGAELPGVHVHVVAGAGIHDVAKTLAFAWPVTATGEDGWSLRRPVTEPSALIFTSGTEAQPKGILHSEATANAGVRIAHDHLGLGDAEIVWMPSPIGHSTGFNFGVRMALYYGYPLVLQDRWNGGAAADLVGRTGATYTLAATTFLADLVDVCQARGVRLDTMRYFGCGGAPVPPPLVARARENGIGVQRLYGSTEALVPVWNPPQAPLAELLNTDGAVVAGVELQIRDEGGQLCPTGVVGDIYVRGPEVCIGFFEDPERLARAFTADGWLLSGDLGYLDDAGHLTIDGRRKEIIIRGGLNISPREIEELVTVMDGVRECVVVGLPDERLGEISCACIVTAPDASTVSLTEVCTHLRDAGLATYKLPERLLLTPELPRTPSGKVRREVLIRSWPHSRPLADERARQLVAFDDSAG